MKQKVIFLDRDGVILKEKSYVTSMNQVEIFSYSKGAISLFHRLGYKVIVITNQSAVARNMMMEETLLQINNYIKQKIDIDDIYYCPHWYNGEREIPPYQIRCNCRKPGTALMEQAAREHNLTFQDAYFVGDRASDIIAGNNINATTVLLESGYGFKNLEVKLQPDLHFKDLEEFAYYLLGNRKK